MKIIDKIQNAINVVFCTALLLLDHMSFHGHFLKFNYFVSELRLINTTSTTIRPSPTGFNY